MECVQDRCMGALMVACLREFLPEEVTRIKLATHKLGCVSEDNDDGLTVMESKG